MNKKSAWTLMEMIVAISVIAILAGFMLSTVNVDVSKAKLFMYATVKNLENAINNFKKLLEKGKRPLCIIGLVSNGNISNFANMIKSHLENSSIMCVTDEFRDKYIDYNRTASSTTFGAETYYGQDFIYK